jgi:hypothetical protein
MPCGPEGVTCSSMRQRIIGASDVMQFQLPVWDIPVVPNST